jgi:hypothetical protein
MLAPPVARAFHALRALLTRRPALIALDPVFAGTSRGATLNGEPSRLIDLSTSGVQLVSPGRLRPTQGFRLTLLDEKRKTRLHAVVAWATLQGTTAAPSYRAGAQFVDSDYEAIDAYCRRYGSGQNQLFVMPSPTIVPSDPAPVLSGAAESRRQARRSA